MRRAGFVLVGGKSIRMGRDKALLPVGRGNLAQLVASRVAAAAGSAALVGDPSIYAGMGYPVFPDFHPGYGPMAGLETILRLGLAEWNLMVACDLPQLNISFLELLVQNTEIAKMERGCIVAMDCNGGTQPLCAIYHLSCLGPVNRAIADKRLKMRSLLRELQVISIAVPDSGTLFNANTPDDWAGLRGPIG